MKRYQELKRKQLMLVAAVTLLVLAGIWFGLVSAQKAALARLAKSKAEVTSKVDAMKLLLKSGDRIDRDYQSLSNTLSRLEGNMASGDLYAWAVTTFRQFAAGYKVDIPQFAQVDGPKEASLFPKFPYQEATLTLVGTGQFYEFGRFLADLENRFPFIQVKAMALETTAPTPNAPEALAFRVELVTLVKPNAS